MAPDSALVSDRVKTINEHSDLVIELRACPNCSHWWNTPTPSQKDLIKLYQNASEYVVSNGWGQEIQKEKPILFFENLILSYPYPASFSHYLEVGCGNGDMFKIMKARMEIAYGVEPGSWSEVDNIVDDFDKIPEHLMFHVFVFQDVIEHFADPISTLSHYSKRASNDALLFVSFPNKDSLIARHNKHQWGMVRPFGHLQYFSRQSLTLLLERCGWQVARLIRGPNRFSLSHWKTYNLPRTLKKMYQNDQWYVVGTK